jgi:hypothetical protein
MQLELTDEEKCEVCRCAVVIKCGLKGLICVVTSGLSETDTEKLPGDKSGTFFRYSIDASSPGSLHYHSLPFHSFSLSPELTESFNSDKTTLCRIRRPLRANGGNLLARRETH